MPYSWSRPDSSASPSGPVTSTSTVRVNATADGAADWLHLYSSSTDPVAGDRVGYAHQENNLTLPFVAAGADTTLAIDWGSYPDDNTTYTFTRSFTFRTAAAFPAGPGTVMVSVAAQAAAGENQPLTSVLIANVGATGGNASVTLGTNQKRQINVKLRAKRQWTPGERFHPSIVVTLTYTGGPANYYVFTVPTVVTVE